MNETYREANRNNIFPWGNEIVLFVLTISVIKIAYTLHTENKKIKKQK